MRTTPVPPTATFGERAVRLLRRLLPELVLVAVGWCVYSLGRLIAAEHVDKAHAHAADIWSVERALGLPDEATLQALAMRSNTLIEIANNYYANVHFPLTLGVLAWLFWKRPQVYRWARSALMWATGVALIIHFTYPLAPPRMFPEWGLVDTGLLFGQSVYGPEGANSMANQFAAMPSLHVGWAALVALVLVRSSRSRWRWLWFLHPLITVVVVVVTANHYWLDGAVGVLLIVVALAACAPPPRGSAPSPLMPPQPDLTHERSSA